MSSDTQHSDIYISLGYDDPEEEDARAYFRMTALDQEHEDEVPYLREMDFEVGGLLELADYLEA